jgi:hypothetical protein
MKYFFSPDGDYLGGFDAGSLVLVPDGSIEVTDPPNHGLDRLVDGVIVPYAPVQTPLEIITDAVKALPVAKRTDVTWGIFISQCLLALQNSDMEALAFLVNGFVTEDTDYLQIIGAAKTLFNL